MGVGARRPRRPARAGARRGSTPRFASPTGWRRCSTRPSATILAVSHALRVRYVLDAAEGTVPAARVERRPARRAVPARAAERRGGRRDAPCLGGARRGSPIPLLVDDARRLARRCILSECPCGALMPSSSRPSWPSSPSLAAGCGGSAVAVPRAVESHGGRAEELRGRHGAVRAHAPDDDARHRRETVLRRRRRVRHPREAGSADGRPVVVRRAPEGPRLEPSGARSRATSAAPRTGSSR